jgi:hypothetical protein
MMITSVYRRAVKMRWPSSYRQRMIEGDGRWLTVVDQSHAAHMHGYKGYVWTTIHLHKTQDEALTTAQLYKHDHDYSIQVLDCEQLSIFAKAQREHQRLLQVKPKPVPVQMGLGI